MDSQWMTIDQLLNAGLEHYRAGRCEQAAELLRLVLLREPRAAEVWRHLGDALAGGGQSEEAIAVYLQSLSLQPAVVETHNNLGNAFQSAGRLDEAVGAFRRAISISPNAYQPRCNLGNALKAADRIEEAVLELRHAVTLEPNSADVWNSLGAALELAGQFNDSIASYEKALALDPNLATAHCNLGLGLLRLGNFERGWREYEWRWKLAAGQIDRREFTQPRWSGDPLRSRRLLVHAEQGIGDAIQFVRYVPLIKPQFGGRVILAVHPELRDLFRQVEGVDQLLIDRQPPDFDVHCPLMSLPTIFKTNLQTIPATSSYLRADPVLAGAWSMRLQPFNNLKQIGLVWAGRPDNTRDRARSLPLSALSTIDEVANVCLFSLQKGQAAEQLRGASSKMRVIDWTGEIHTFSDTAALVDNLDLVITVDTAVAHLSGAMGKPTWLLLPFMPDWRWMLDRDNSPWYPTMRLFRQTQQKSWTQPIEAIVRALAELNLPQVQNYPPAGPSALMT